MFFNLKILCAFLLVVGYNVVLSASVALAYPIKITKFKIEDWKPDGYSFEYETSSGTSRKERGYLKNDLNGDPQLVTEGEFSYTDDRDQFYKVTYTADENGYHPKVITENSAFTPAAKNLNNDGDFVFPDDVTEGYPSDITTIFPEEATLDNRIDLSPQLIASLLGGG